MKKRILVALSAVVLVAAMLVATVSAASFDDVKEGDWFYDAVQYVSENGIMNGTGDGFAPTRILTRAEMAVMLYNLEVNVYGEPEAAEEAPFLDIDGVKSWAGTAINWAYANGIVKGTNAEGTNFSPTVTLNRASMAVMFTNYIELKGLTDVVEISRVDDTVGSFTMFGDEFDWENYDWYWDQVHYVGKVGLMGGKDSGNPDLPNFDPEGTASRAEAATVLARLHKFVKIPTLGAERAWALFNEDYLCTVHGDMLLNYDKRGTNVGSTQATTASELLKLQNLIDVVDEKLDYDRDDYYLVMKDSDSVLEKLNNSSTGNSVTVTYALVRWDGAAELENTFDIGMAQREYYSDALVNRKLSITIADWCCNDTEENLAADIKADLEPRMDQFIEYITADDGKVHIQVKDTEIEWIEWLNQTFNYALVNSGIGGNEHWVGILGFIDEDDFKNNDGNKGANWTEELQAKKDAIMNALNNGQSYEFTDTLVFTMMAGRQTDDGVWGGMDATIKKDITVVLEKTKNNINMYNDSLGNLVVPTDLVAEEITEHALCEDCGKLHYICSDATITEDSLFADFKDMNQVLFNKNKYVVTGLKLDDQFKADLSNMLNLDVVSGKAVFTFTDAYSMSKTLDVEIELTIQMNTNIKKKSSAYADSAVTLGICPDSEGRMAGIELDAFINNYTCDECGVIHYNVNKISNATVAKLNSKLLDAIGAKAKERTVAVTSDNKTLVNNGITDAVLKAALEADGRLTKTVTIVYAVSANNDVATRQVVLDIRLNSSLSNAIVTTQTLVNEISGETFITCPYNLDNITAFEKSVIEAKVNKIVAEKGTDGTIYAWYGLGFKNNDKWNNGNGTPEVRVDLNWAPHEAYYLVTRFADFTDCTRALLDDDGTLYYSEFTEETFSKVAKTGNELNAAADKTFLFENAELSLHFQTKTTGTDVYVPVKLSVGRDNRVGFGGDPKCDAWAFCKSIDDTMAEERAAIQGAIDKVAADLGKDGVLAMCINKNYTFGNGWRPGNTSRIYFDQVSEYFAGLTSAWVNDGMYIYGCLSEEDWKAMSLDNPSNMVDGVVRDGSKETTTFSIRGPKSGVAQDYEIKLTLVQGPCDNANHVIEVGSEHVGALAK